MQIRLSGQDVAFVRSKITLRVMRATGETSSSIVGIYAMRLRYAPDQKRMRIIW
jgi:hypothetical protein